MRPFYNDVILGLWMFACTVICQRTGVLTTPWALHSHGGKQAGRRVERTVEQNPSCIPYLGGRGEPTCDPVLIVM